jgi:hypothetical protein
MNKRLIVDKKNYRRLPFQFGPRPGTKKQLQLPNKIKRQNLLEGVMRYLIDRILHKPFSILLPDSQRDFLVAVEKSMKKMEPQKGELHVETKI